MMFRERARMLLAAMTLMLLPAFALGAQSAAGPATASSAERIPFKQDEDELGATIWRAALATAGIALIAVVAVYAMRRHGLAPIAGTNDAKAVRLVQTLRTGPKTTLLVVRFGAQRVLLGQSERGLQVLASEPAEDS
jgi:hypothetical protein